MTTRRPRSWRRWTLLAATLALTAIFISSGWYWLCFRPTAWNWGLAIESGQLAIVDRECRLELNGNIVVFKDNTLHIIDGRPSIVKGPWGYLVRVRADNPWCTHGPWLWGWSWTTGTYPDMRIPLWILIAPLAAACAWSWRRAARPPGQCRCGYNLTGLPHGAVCPECSTPQK
jgi:hypothetical protein